MLVYVDAVIVLNFLVDLLLLAGTNRLAGFPVGWKRAVLAAALGSVYAAGCLMPGFRFLGRLHWRCISLLLMGGLAFGLRWEALRRTGIFLLLSFSLGGCAQLVSRGGLGELAAAGAGILVLSVVSLGRGLGKRQLVAVEIPCGSGSLHLTALADTGNVLRDPFTGESALIVDSPTAQKLTGLTADQLADPCGTLGALPGLRLLPYRTVGQPSGMLLAKRLRGVRIGHRQSDPLVAFAPNVFGEEYQVLTGGMAE